MQKSSYAYPSSHTVPPSSLAGRRELVNNILTTKISSGLNVNEFRCNLQKVELWKEWDNQWSQSNASRDLKNPNIPSLSKMQYLNPNAESIQILSGFFTLKSYLFKKAIIKSPLCNCIEEEETMEHFLFRCKLFTKHRIIFQSEAKPTPYSWPTKLTHFPESEIL